MATIEHLRNFTEFFDKNSNPQVAKLRMHYVRCRREFGETAESPKRKLDAVSIAVACPSCGSSWTSTRHSTRVVPRIKSFGRIARLARGSLDGAELSDCRHALIELYKKKRSNRIRKICSDCSQVNEFPLVQTPERRARVGKIPSESENVDSALAKKKKKKRSKDRTAGLNISRVEMPIVDRTALLGNKKTCAQICTPSLELKRSSINLAKLRGIVDAGATTSKKSKLHAFLQLL